MVGIVPSMVGVVPSMVGVVPSMVGVVPHHGIRTTYIAHTWGILWGGA